VKTALRNIFRHKLYSFLNIIGLSIGIASCILIIFYVHNELSYDRFNVNADLIYRLCPTITTAERSMRLTTNAHPMAPMLKEDYPEIEEYVRFTPYGGKQIVEHDGIVFYEERFVWTDDTLFDVFSFELIKGDEETALRAPYSLVLTQDIARKYFGTEDPIGRELRVNQNDLYKVTGVMKNVPQTSHIRPEIFASISSLELKPTGNSVRDLLSSINYFTYFQLREGTAIPELEQKFAGFIDKHLGPVLKNLGGSVALDLQPLTDIYLHSDRENEMERTSDITYVYLFAGIGLFILLLACLNFMNLSTARSANRAKEVGLRKVVGAHKSQLMRQFLGESSILTFISIILSLVLVFISTPLFRNISGKNLSAASILNPVLLAGLLGLFVVISFIGGSYPAFFLSAFRPVEVLQGKLRRGSKRSILRIAMVSLQFTVSIVLIIGTLIVGKQLNYIRNKKLGYEKDHIVTLQMRDPETQKKHETLKEIISRHPNVLATSASATTPLGWNDFRGDHAEGKPENEVFMMFAQFVDHDFFDLYEMKIVQGREFSDEYPADAKEAIIVNQTMASKLGWTDDPINKTVDNNLAPGRTRQYRVVGVVEDYHFQSLHDSIAPMVIYNSCLFGGFDQISVKVRPENIQETIGFLKTTWESFDSKFPFEYAFLNDQYDQLYRAEERLGQLFGYFTLLAIAIGCLGLFGLTSFTAEQRTKEIGIRKVLGASVPGIVSMLVREFTRWVVLAVFIAWPIGYFVMSTWLQSFAYRIDLGIGTFLLAAFMAFIIAVITVCYQSIKAALSNPVQALKYE